MGLCPFLSREHLLAVPKHGQRGLCLHTGGHVATNFLVLLPLPAAGSDCLLFLDLFVLRQHQNVRRSLYDPLNWLFHSLAVAVIFDQLLAQCRLQLLKHADLNLLRQIFNFLIVPQKDLACCCIEAQHQIRHGVFGLSFFVSGLLVHLLGLWVRAHESRYGGLRRLSSLRRQQYLKVIR